MKVPRWSAVRDDKGRIMIAICHNSDVGDAWEFADVPYYPEAMTRLACQGAVEVLAGRTPANLVTSQ